MPEDQFIRAESIPELLAAAGLTLPVANVNEAESAVVTVREGTLDLAGISFEREGTEKLGRYTITGYLGAGAMGEVLQVRDEDLGRELAAKVIQGHYDLRTLAKFIREAQVTGQLEHPNIVPLYELGLTEDRLVYFTMRRVQGDTLADLLKELSEQESASQQNLRLFLDVLVKVCDAVSYAHHRGVVHRDLKPANIMIGRFGVVQVMDWGLAKVMKGEEGDPHGFVIEPSSKRFGIQHEPAGTVDGAIAGTPAYMSPEQADGRVSEIGPASDVYSMGAILYEILTLCPPYQGQSVIEVLTQVVRGDLVAPRKRAPRRNIPEPLEEITLRAMAQDPGDRFASVASMKREILSFLSAGVTAWAVRSTRSSSRHRAPSSRAQQTRQGRLLAGIATALTFLSLVGLYAVLGGTNKRPAPPSEESRPPAPLDQPKGGPLPTISRELPTKRTSLSRNRGKQWPSRGADRRRRLQQATSALELGQLEEAEQQVRRAVGPGDPEGLLWKEAIGRLDWGSLIGILESACKERKWDRLGRLAGVRLEEKDADRLEQFIARTKDRIRSLGDRPREQMEGYTYYLYLKPKDFKAWVNRGECYRKLGKDDLALADYNTAIRLAPDEPKIINNRALIWRDQKKYDQAIADWTLALTKSDETDAFYRNLLVNRGVTYILAGKPREALADLEKVRRIKHPYVQIAILLAEAEQGQKARAVKELNGWLEKRPGRVIASLGRVRSHVALCSRLIALMPDNPLAYAERASLNLLLGNKARARQDLHKAIDLAGRDTPFKQHLETLKEMLARAQG